MFLSVGLMTVRCSIGAASAIVIEALNENEHDTEELVFFFEICNHLSGL